VKKKTEAPLGSQSEKRRDRGNEVKNQSVLRGLQASLLSIPVVIKTDDSVLPGPNKEKLGKRN